jgi:hypothetical protein
MLFDWIRRLTGGRRAPPYRNLWAGEMHTWSVERPRCTCLGQQFEDSPRNWDSLRLHTEQQETASRAWNHISELIERAARDGRRAFIPARDMDPADYASLVTLPPTIGKLKKVRHLNLYGSSLVRIPIEIGEMTNLQQFSPYTSYRLHWFPYEITRCTNLKESTVSTRALYGNYKYRPPFPELPQLNEEITPGCCSVCQNRFNNAPIQVWISLRVATDVLPLLVHACSKACIQRLPTPPDGYIKEPHQGGHGVVQPGDDDEEG